MVVIILGDRFNIYYKRKELQLLTREVACNVECSRGSDLKIMARGSQEKIGKVT
jgi:hypothetical protein